MSRARFVIVRTVQMVFLIWMILSLIFIFFRLLPGDFTSLMIFRGAPESSVVAFREKWGLDEPLYIQYYVYMINFIQGDVGTSLIAQKPVIEYIKPKILNSFILVGPGITVGYLLGSLLGSLFGTRRGTKFEEYGLIPVLFFSSFPAFFLALVIIIIFAGILDLFPTSGMYTYSGAAIVASSWWAVYTSKDFLWHFTLPFLTIVVRYISTPTLIMRTSLVETLGQEFTFYHRITGISRSRQMKHLIRHSMLPVITLYPISMTRAIGGLVLIEKVFNWPGIGSTLVSAVLQQDYPVVQFIFFLIATFVILSNFVIDILYGIIDPRVSVEE